MGLTTWKNSPDGRILQSDVNVAKNYLSEKQIRNLERNISSYFDYVERLLEDEKPRSMQAFANSIDEFLKFNRYEVLETTEAYLVKMQNKKLYQSIKNSIKIRGSFLTLIKKSKKSNEDQTDFQFSLRKRPTHKKTLFSYV